MADDHITVTDDPNYDVTLHPAFASKITIKPEGGPAKTLYRQREKHYLNTKSHPKQHQIKLKGKGNGRDVTITIDDPNHSISRISVDLYEEDHDPMSKTESLTSETLTVYNEPITCPPWC